MTTETLASTLEGFLSRSSSAVVIEGGAVVFDLGHAKYSVSGESNKCLLHLWSQERNVVRRVLDVESKGETLRVTVQRIGQARPTKLDICRERDLRTASAKRVARMAHQRILERVLRAKFPDLTLVQMSTSIDLAGCLPASAGWEAGDRRPKAVGSRGMLCPSAGAHGASES